MKSLDIRTMMVMVSILSFLFSGLLTLASLQAGTIRGMRHWALASFFTCFALGLAITQPTAQIQSWMVVIGATLLFASGFFQFHGIKAFKGERGNWLISGVLMGVAAIINTWLVIIHPDINARIIFNSIGYSTLNLLCARALLIRIQAPQRTAYWFTGSIFVLQSLFFAIRAIIFIFTHPGGFNLYGNFLINPATFLMSGCTQLCLTFGFILMLNYRLASDLKDLASTDALTGALNRRSLEHEAASFESLFTRTRDSLTVVLLDIDHFKLLNDNYGHAMGDTVLKQLPTVAKTIIREYDCFARYGGEEFCILLPSTTESEALLIAERLRLAYAATFQAIDHQNIHSTISIGVADSAQVGLTFAALSKAADQAMYRAKQGGRNRVIGYSALGNQNRGQPVNFDS